MNGGNRQESKSVWHRRAGVAIAITFVATMPTQTRADEDARIAAAKRWYASQNSDSRSLDGRISLRPSEQARQQVRLDSREPAGARSQQWLVPVTQEDSAYQPAPSNWITVSLVQELPEAQAVLHVAGHGGAYCGMSALPAMGLTAVGLLGFSGLARRRSPSQNQC